MGTAWWRQKGEFNRSDLGSLLFWLPSERPDDYHDSLDGSNESKKWAEHKESQFQKFSESSETCHSLMIKSKANKTRLESLKTIHFY